MFAIEQVEITKGSASAMGGAGTTGGSINMISKVAKRWLFRRFCGAGTDDYQRITLDGNKDFGNGIAARVAVMGHHNDKAGQRRWYWICTCRYCAKHYFWSEDSDTRATLSYYYLKTDDTPDSGIPYNNPTGKFKTGLNGKVKPIDVKQGCLLWLERSWFPKTRKSIRKRSSLNMIWLII